MSEFMVRNELANGRRNRRSILEDWPSRNWRFHKIDLIADASPAWRYARNPDINNIKKLLNLLPNGAWVFTYVLLLIGEARTH